MSMIACLIVAAAATASAAEAPTMARDYQGRYDCQPGEPDHLLDAVEVAPDRIVVAGNRGLALLDRTALPAGGTTAYVDRLTGLNARNVYPGPDGNLYVNLSRVAAGTSAGFAVVSYSGDTLSLVTTRDEPDTLYEKMAVAGAHLYVAAHGRGIRVFDISDPETTVLVGRLDEGLTDAWAVAPDGNDLWVADGAGGLKRVNIADPANPVVLWGEDPETALGTAEDVVVGSGKIYVAAGGEGLLIYDPANLSVREAVDTGGAAKDLEWVDGRLVAATLAGLVVVEPGEPSVVVAAELTARRNQGRLRLCSAVGAVGDDEVIASNWNYADVYRLADLSTSAVPDITCDTQRHRFDPAGGGVTVSCGNDGGVPLEILGAQSSHPAFSVDLQPVTLDPGEQVAFAIDCDGTPMSSGVVTIFSDDPDENPLPIQVFGDTPYLDPRETAVDFELPMLSRDPLTGDLVEGTFRLSDHLGKVVWFQIYGFW